MSIDAYRSIATRTFSAGDQLSFAEWSGDWNPVHVDPQAARRVMFGQPVVHGMHLLMWALEVASEQGLLNNDHVQHIRVSFRQPAFLDEELVVSVTSPSQDLLDVLVRCDGSTLTTITLGLNASPEPICPSSIDHGVPARRPPADLAIDQLEGMRGRVRVSSGHAFLTDRFPASTTVLGAPVLAHFGAVTAVIGMECPGLHSVMVGLDLRIEPRSRSESLEWRAVRVSEPLSAVRLEVSGLIAGTVSAFVRPRPVDQLSTEALSGMVNAGEFHGVRALVVGGSRGLGEVASKLVAAGGGDVVLTYHRGESDARRVASEIQQGGGRASIFRADVVSSGDFHRADPVDTGGLTHLLYFASPRITSRRLREYDAEHLRTMFDVYVHGFLTVAEAVRQTSLDNLDILYPSTVYVDQPPEGLLEYALAKAAGEACARIFGQRHPGVRVHVERFPPLATDQTATTRREDMSQEFVATTLLEALRHSRRLGD